MPDETAAPRPQLSPRDLAIFRRLQQRFLTNFGNRPAVAVTAAAGTVAVAFPRAEADALYGVSVTPNWGTTAWVTAKTTTGFTVNFGTVAPANATVDIITFRSE